MDSEDINQNRRLLKTMPLVKALFLVLIIKNPDISGYQLMRLVSEITNNEITLKTGTVYTELRRLERNGFVSSTQSSAGRKQRHYKITEEGVEELRQLRSQIERRINLLLNPLLKLIESTLS